MAFARKTRPLMDLVTVTSGTFIMGSTDGDTDEKPIHTVTLGSLQMSRTEVTQAQYVKIMGANPSRFKGENRPVENVSWFDAVAFCNRLSQSEGPTPAYTINGTDVSWNRGANGYRLPTEAEWECSAWGATFAGGSNVDAISWHSSNSGGQTHEVATKISNELGPPDMSGNVWEWCWDWYGIYSSGSQTDPTGPSSGTYRVRRGGSWYSAVATTRVSYRNYDAPDGRNGDQGFRVVCAPVR